MRVSANVLSFSCMCIYVRCLLLVYAYTLGLLQPLAKYCTVLVLMCGGGGGGCIDVYVSIFKLDFQVGLVSCYDV